MTRNEMPPPIGRRCPVTAPCFRQWKLSYLFPVWLLILINMSLLASCGGGAVVQPGTPQRQPNTGNLASSSGHLVGPPHLRLSNLMWLESAKSRVGPLSLPTCSPGDPGDIFIPGPGNFAETLFDESNFRGSPPPAVTGVTFTPPLPGGYSLFFEGWIEQPQQFFSEGDLRIMTTSGVAPATHVEDITWNLAQKDHYGNASYTYCYKIVTNAGAEIVDVNSGSILKSLPVGTAWITWWPSPGPPTPTPNPVPTTVIGKHIKLKAQTIGTGTLNSPVWWGNSQTPDPTSAIKAYALSTPAAARTLLSSTDLSAASLNFYWLQAGGGAVNLTYADNPSGSTYALNAFYLIEGPTFGSMDARTNPVQVGPYHAGQGPQLSVGTVISLPTSGGIYWVHPTYTYKATAPKDFDGYISITQILQSNYSQVPNPLSTATPPAPPPSTGTAYWLDACPLYTVLTNGDSGITRNLYVAKGAQVTYDTVDAPTNGLLTTTLNSQTQKDNFIDYFMYRPSGAESIWVSFGKLTWFWSGTATRTGDPHVNGGWVLATPTPTPMPSIVHGTVEQGELPSWPNVYEPGACAPLPSK